MKMDLRESTLLHRRMSVDIRIVDFSIYHLLLGLVIHAIPRHVLK